MGGFFGTVSQQPCAADLFYGTDYQSHLGTRRGGMATYSSENGFSAASIIWKVHTSELALNLR